jgi:hypothetical protein
MSARYESVSIACVVYDCIGRFRRSAILFPGTVRRNEKSEHMTTYLPVVTHMNPP